MMIFDAMLIILKEIMKKEVVGILKLAVYQKTPSHFWCGGVKFILQYAFCGAYRPAVIYLQELS